MFIAVLSRAVELGGFEINLYVFMVVFIISVAVILPAIIFRKWFFYRRRLRKNIITAEFEPPAGFTPAEISFLFAGKLSERVVGATIIHLVQRGLLSMKMVNNEKRVFVGPRVDDKISSYEKMIISHVAEDEGVSGALLLKEEVKFGLKGKKLTRIPKSEAIGKLAKEDLTRKGYLRKSYFGKFLLSSLGISIIILFWAVWLPLTVSVLLDTINIGASEFQEIKQFLVLGVKISAVSIIPLFIVSAFIITQRSKIIGRDWMVASKLKRLWPQVIGFRQYVHLSEGGVLKHRTEKLKKTSNNDMLPYSVALGFVDNWRDIVS